MLSLESSKIRYAKLINQWIGAEKMDIGEGGGIGGLGAKQVSFGSSAESIFFKGGRLTV